MIQQHQLLNGHEFEQPPGESEGQRSLACYTVPCHSVAQSFLTLCGLMDCNSPGFPVLHHLPEFVSGGQNIGDSASACLSNAYSGLIAFRIDWFDLLAVQGTQESSLTPQFESINSLALSLLYGPTLTFVHGYWKNHSFDYTDFCWQSDVSGF